MCMNKNTQQLNYGSYAQKCVCLYIQHWDCFPLEANTALRLLAGRFRQLRASCNFAGCNKGNLVPIRSTNYQTLFPRCPVLLCRHSTLFKVLQIHCSQTWHHHIWCNRFTWCSKVMPKAQIMHWIRWRHAVLIRDVHCFYMLPATSVHCVVRLWLFIQTKVMRCNLSISLGGHPAHDQAMKCNALTTTSERDHLNSSMEVCNQMLHLQALNWGVNSFEVILQCCQSFWMYTHDRLDGLF